jgi:hypothetical protein
METSELRQTARRAYELGRVRLSGKVAGAALLVGAAAVGLGRPLVTTALLGSVLAALVAFIVFRGGPAGRAVWPALASGTGAMFLPLAIRTAGCSLFGPQCMRFCLPACVAGGAVMGVALALTARHEERGAGELLTAGAAVAALTASIGCSVMGAAGVLGMALGTIAVGAPIWLAARPARSS